MVRYFREEKAGAGRERPYRMLRRKLHCMKKNMVRLADIAARTGYSVNTISHALHDKPDISEETKAFIKRTAEEMGYIVNASASSLRSGKTKSIAVIVGDISNPHFSIMIKEIENALRLKNYTAFIFNTDEDEELERDAIKSAKSKNADGILLCPVQKSTKNVEYLETLGIPYVLIGRHFDTPKSAGYVVCDDENSGYLAAEHLILNHHRHILFINGPSYISSSRERLHGVIRAARHYGLDETAIRCCECSVTVHDDTGWLREAFLLNPECSAVICFSDFLAMEAVWVLQRMGRRIPQDVSVLGFDNIESKFYLPLMLTSITSSKTKMSQSAVNLLLEMFEENRAPRGIVLPTELIQRESTRKI